MVMEDGQKNNYQKTGHEYGIKIVFRFRKTVKLRYKVDEISFMFQLKIGIENHRK